MIVRGVMKIMFYVTENNKIGYSTKYVTRATFKFSTDRYHIGFFEPRVLTDYYFFNNDYLVDIVFPWADEELVRLFDDGIDDIGNIEICLGSQTIGHASLQAYSLTEE